MDDTNDGYDASIPYQMVPQGRERYMKLETGNVSVEMTVALGAPCGLSNFHVTRTWGKVPGLPTRASATQRVVIPANTEVQFDITGGYSEGHGLLQVRQMLGNGRPPRPELEMLLSVKERWSRNFLACYVYDKWNVDSGVRSPVKAAIETAHGIFHEQANVIILMNGQPGSLTLTGSIGPEFDVADKDLVKRLLKQTMDVHGQDVFDRHTAVIYLVPVPVLGGWKKDGTRDRPIAINVHYEWKKKNCHTIFVAAPTAASKTVLDLQLGHNLAHEIGHELGLEHLPEDEADVFPKDMPKPQKDAKKQEIWIHNLMFPSNLMLSNRLNGLQIEKIRVGRPNRPRIHLED
jgi:hypothetical protein